MKIHTCRDESDATIDRDETARGIGTSTNKFQRAG